MATDIEHWVECKNLVHTDKARHVEETPDPFRLSDPGSGGGS